MDAFLQVQSQNYNLVRTRFARLRPPSHPADGQPDGSIDSDSLRLLLELAFKERPGNLYITMSLARLASWPTAEISAFCDAIGAQVPGATAPQDHRIEQPGGGQSTRMLELMTGGSPRDPALDRSFFTRSQGNPYFLEELVKWSQEQGLLYFQGLGNSSRSGGDRAAEHPADSPVAGRHLPDEVREVLSRARSTARSSRPGWSGLWPIAMRGRSRMAWIALSKPA